MGTAGENLSEGLHLNQLVEFTPDPHVATQSTGTWQTQQVQSPGYVNIVGTRALYSDIVFSGTATGINDHNNIIFNENSYVSTSNGYISVLVPHLVTTASGDTALGTLGGLNGIVNALNNSNQVVGWSQTASGAQHAFLYSNGTIQDLNLLIPPLSGITLVSAVGIDAAGEIVAYGTNSSGQIREYLLTPRRNPRARAEHAGRHEPHDHRTRGPTGPKPARPALIRQATSQNPLAQIRSESVRAATVPELVGASHNRFARKTIEPASPGKCERFRKECRLGGNSLVKPCTSRAPYPHLSPTQSPAH